MTSAIRREMRRHAAIEPVIGHLKKEHRMDRNYLGQTEADSGSPGSAVSSLTEPGSFALAARLPVRENQS